MHSHRSLDIIERHRVHLKDFSFSDGYAGAFHADMVELADTPDLGSGAFRRTGSSPAIRTKYKTSENRCIAGFFRGFSVALSLKWCLFGVYFFKTRFTR